MSDSGLRSPQNSSKSNLDRNHSMFNHQNQGAFKPNNSTSYRPRPNQGEWNSNQKIGGPSNNQKQEGYTDASTAMIMGPRANHECNSSSKTSTGDRRQGQNCQRDKYNLEDFKSEYESAKFYVIKSISEDDIHKSIKYKVWSSTPRGNEKLDHAFLDAEAKRSKTGEKHPIFLFFSVNTSGQFLGVAEMIGQVDFNKNLDFWQADRWIGFFPVKWHIIKDVPHQLFRHIILENNFNRAVTFTRDTQEVLLKQGVEMLRIFKKYIAKTSLLDDFNFYENREKSLKANRCRKSLSNTSVIPNERKIGNQSEADDMTSSLVKLAL